MSARTDQIKASAMKALERIRATLEATGEVERGKAASEVNVGQGGVKGRSRRVG